MPSRKTWYPSGPTNLVEAPQHLRPAVGAVHRQRRAVDVDHRDRGDAVGELLGVGLEVRREVGDTQGAQPADVAADPGEVLLPERDRAVVEQRSVASLALADPRLGRARGGDVLQHAVKQALAVGSLPHPAAHAHDGRRPRRAHDLELDVAKLGRARRVRQHPLEARPPIRREHLDESATDSALPRQPHQPDPLVVHLDDHPLGRERLVGEGEVVIEAAEALLARAQGCLRGVAGRHVADDGLHRAVLAEPEADLGRQPGAVLAQHLALGGRSGRRGRAGREQRRQAARREQIVHRPPHQLVPRVARHAADGRVDGHEPAAAVGHHDPVGGLLDQRGVPAARCGAGPRAPDASR